MSRWRTTGRWRQPPWQHAARKAVERKEEDEGESHYLAREEGEGDSGGATEEAEGAEAEGRGWCGRNKAIEG